MAIATAEIGGTQIHLGKTVTSAEFYEDPRNVWGYFDVCLRKSYALGGLNEASNYLIENTRIIRNFVLTVALPEIKKYGRFYYNPLTRDYIESMRGVVVTQKNIEAVANADAIIQSNFLPVENPIEEVEELRSKQLNPKELYEGAVSGILLGMQQHALENPGQRLGVMFFDSKQMRVHIGTLGFLAYQASGDEHLMSIVHAAGELTGGASGGRFRQALQMLYKGLLLSPNSNREKRQEGIACFKEAIDTIGYNVWVVRNTPEADVFAYKKPLTTSSRTIPPANSKGRYINRRGGKRAA